MVRDEMSSDLDLVKELEQLKLKQRLLIETLRRKNDLQETKIQQQISAKLDFLVKIFKDTSGQDQEKEKFEHLDVEFKEVKDQFTQQQLLLTQLSDKLTTMDQKLTKLTLISQTPSAPVAPPKPAFVVSPQNGGK